ncbi:MAG: DUF1289 domain-containing protein [Methylobacter sp.]
MVNIASPCIRNCCLNEENICLGCFRSIDEIMQWNNVTEQQKREILNLANARKIDHRLKYGVYPDSGDDSAKSPRTAGFSFPLQLRNRPKSGS